MNQYTVAGPASFTYDANGNLTSDGSTTFLYDIENRLVSTSGAKTAGLTYDTMGRLWKVTGTTTDTRFLYDGDELVAEYDAAGTMARRYVHSDNADDPVVQYDGAGVGAAARTFLMPDERGSIVGLIYDNGTARAINAYDEYGIPGSANQGRFQYIGQAWLPELGMYHYKARIYSPTLGRFLQTDPIGYDDQVNLYAYVANDPVNKSDPTGEKIDWERVGQFTWGTAEMAGGAAAIITGAAGDAGSGLLTIASGGTLAPGTVPMAVASTGLIVGGVGLVADGAKNITNALSNKNSNGNSGDGRTGGGRNAQKSNPDRVSSAQQRINNAKQDLQSLKSQPNKTPADKAEITKLEKQIKTDQIRIRESENHSMRDKR